MTTDTTEPIRDIQRALGALGHSPGTIDGLWGLRTARALKSLLAANGRAASLAPPGPLPWITEAKSALGRHETRDRSWLMDWQEVQPIPGAVLVFKRGSGGHVGCALGQDGTHFHVLGGNQSDAVTFARIARTRLLGARWPATVPPRAQRLPTMKPGEYLTTTNEA